MPGLNRNHHATRPMEQCDKNYTPRMTFAEYLQKVAEYHARNGANIRLGQSYVNCLPLPILEKLMFNEPFLALEIDPFFDDSKLPQFLAHIETLFEN